MQKLSNRLLILLVLSIILALSNQQTPPGSDAIHLSHIQSLTLQRDRYTTGKRTHPIQQLRCIQKIDSYEPETVQCVNKGSDGKTYNWKCEANLREGYKFGKLNVDCEGYRYAGDDFVLKGSCSLEYSLEKTSNSHNQQKGNTPHYKHEPIPSNPVSLGSFVIVVMVLVVVGCIWLSKQSNSTRAYEQPRTYPSMYPDANPNVHRTHDSSIPTFLAGAAAGYAGSSLYNSQRNTGTGSYFESPSYGSVPGNNYSNYETYPNYSHDNDNDNTREHTTTGYAETSSR